jgi:uncharacterized cupredoxin-like copper-binding protein
MKTTHLVAAGVIAVAGAAATAGGEHAHGTAPAGGSADRMEQTDWGIAGDPKAARRTIRVTASDDLRFTPAIIEVGEGETVKFVLRNAGQSQHEMVLGTRKALDAHAAAMRKFPQMRHDEPHMTHVAPRQEGSIVWTFNRPGEFDFACLVPGHYDNGMIGRIRVVPRPGHKH